MKQSWNFSNGLVALILLAIQVISTSTPTSPARAQTLGWDQPLPGLTAATIAWPTEGSKPGVHFEIGGKIVGKPRNLWLLVRIGDMYWPKEPRVNVNGGSWKGIVNEGGSSADGTFEVHLIDTSDEFSKTFEAWIRDAHAAGRYPALTESAIGLATGESKALARRRFRF